MTSERRRKSARTYAKKRREARIAAGRCVDEPTNAIEPHGVVYRGNRCKLCWNKSRKKAY